MGQSIRIQENEVAATQDLTVTESRILSALKSERSQFPTKTGWEFFNPVDQKWFYVPLLIVKGLYSKGLIYQHHEPAILHSELRLSSAGAMWHGRLLPD